MKKKSKSKSNKFVILGTRLQLSERDEIAAIALRLGLAQSQVARMALLHALAQDAVGQGIWRADGV